MNLTEITFSRVKNQIELYLRQEHSKSNVLFSPASPYGQILTVVENLYQLSMLYLKNSIKQFDLSEVNTTNGRVIRNAAIFAGHNPGRPISATGTLRLQLKSNIDIQFQIPGSRVTIFNRQLLRNKTNNYNYSLNLGIERATLQISNNSQFFLPIIQGRWERKNFTGTGEPNQSINVSIRGNTSDVENFNYEVLVNGQFWSIKKHIYEMLPDEMACVVKTGFDSGIDIIFGNGGFGMIPPIGSLIEVNYLVSDGSVGSIFRRTLNDFTFVDPAVDGFGNTIDLANLFDVSIYTDINFGADRESLLFTKNLLPISSNNFVLGLPQQFAYQIKKLGVFSHVNAYERFGSIYIVATPNIRLFKNQNANYFTVDLRAFELDDYEKSKINTYLRTAGNLLLTRRYQIDSPTLVYYILNVFIITYSDAQDDHVNAQIYDRVSEYFLDFNRLDRVPKSDIISLLSAIPDIHSVDVSFTSKSNEDYHRVELLRQENIQKTAASFASLKLARTKSDYNPNAKIGLDPVLGDIIFQPSELPIIRGGWYDRNGIFFSSNIDESGLKSINIIKKGTVDSSTRQKI